MYIIGEFSKIIYVNKTTLRNWENYIIYIKYYIFWA